MFTQGISAGGGLVISIISYFFKKFVRDQIASYTLSQYQSETRRKNQACQGCSNGICLVSGPDYVLYNVCTSMCTHKIQTYTVLVCTVSFHPREP